MGYTFLSFRVAPTSGQQIGRAGEILEYDRHLQGFGWYI
jgi:hypothetical protein